MPIDSGGLSLGLQVENLYIDRKKKKGHCKINTQLLYSITCKSFSGGKTHVPVTVTVRGKGGQGSTLAWT